VKKRARAGARNVSENDPGELLLYRTRSRTITGSVQSGFYRVIRAVPRAIESTEPVAGQEIVVAGTRRRCFGCEQRVPGPVRVAVHGDGLASDAT